MYFDAIYLRVLGKIIKGDVMKVFSMIKRMWDKYGFYVSLCVCGVFIAFATLIAGREENIIASPEEVLPQKLMGEYVPYPDFTSDIADTNTEKNEDPIYDESMIITNDGQMTFYPALGAYRVHKGVDIDCEQAICLESGKVLEVFEDSFNGLSVRIEALNGIWLYASLESADVKEGDIVNRGDNLGRCGISPVEKHLGAHLHVEFMPNDNE